MLAPVMHLGFTEVLFVLIILLLLFGPQKIPQLGDAIGKGIRNFKKAATQDDSIDVSPPQKQQSSQLGAGTPAGTPAAAQPSDAAKKS
jgi:sec-independent protein translocase protein TatA